MNKIKLAIGTFATFHKRLRQLILATFVCMSCPIVLVTAHAKTELDDSYIISNATVIDVQTGDLNIRDILVRDGKIAALALPGQLKSLGHSTTVDANGNFVIPGLWDAHAHIAIFPGDASILAKLYIANGVTSIRDMGGPLDLLLELRRDSLEGKGDAIPNMKIAGPIIDGAPRINHGRKYKADSSVEVNTPGEAVRLVDDLVAKGVDFIKPYEFLRPEVFKALVARAKYHSLPVAGHIPVGMSVTDIANFTHAISVQYDFQHLTGNMAKVFFEAVKDDIELPDREAILEARGTETAVELLEKMYSVSIAPEVYDPEKIDSVIALLAEKGAWVTPTAAASTVVGLEALGLENDPYAGKTVVDYHCKAFRHALANELGKPWRRVLTEIKSNFSGDNNKRILQKMHAASIPFLAGGESHVAAGFNIHAELAGFVNAGLTPLEALQTATINPAKFLNISDETGTIEVGKSADLLLLQKNPLEKIENTRTISAVILRGRYMNSQHLEELINDVSEDCELN
jgi:imidazolonepropionase-like amidohydrolase